MLHTQPFIYYNNLSCKRLYTSINMKKLLTIFSLIVCLINTTMSQTGSRYPIDETSIWRVDHIRNGVSDENNHVEGDEIFKYHIIGDTIINGKTYYKLYKTGILYTDIPGYYENIYSGAIRDENNKFYFIEKNTVEEVLLYNFNANVNDTIQVPYDDHFETKIVSSVDSLPDGRKLIHFNPKEPMIGCGDQYIIEGIGGSGGLLEGPACFHFWTFDNHLVCYVQQDILEYHDYDFNFNCEVVNHGDKPIIDSTSAWRIDKQSISTEVSNFEKLKYFISGDTIINTIKYWKLCKSGYQLTIPEDGQYSSVFNNTVYVGALREDNHRIYFIPNGDDTEALLYNFALNVSDIINAVVFSNDTIQSIDTILDNRKFFYVNEDQWQDFIVEGIGSDKGLLENKDDKSTLICYMQNEAPLYHTGSGTECNLCYNEISFSNCDKISTLPSPPTTNDETKIISRLCFSISYDDPDYPTLSGSNFAKNGNSMKLILYYNLNDQNNEDDIKSIFPKFDTMNLGYLSEGNYSFEMIVHTIHHQNGTNVDTTFYDKGEYITFSVTKPNNLPKNTAPDNAFHVFPIPANEFITIESINDENRIIRIEIYDILGHKIKAFDMQNQYINYPYQINLGGLNTGIYLLRIQTNSTSYTKRIIIE